MKVFGKKISLSTPSVVLLVIALAAFFIFWKLGKPALIDWDESIYAAVAREMVERNDFLTLFWNKQTFFEKPPLYFWLTAGMFKLFGVSEFTARFWSAWAGVLGVGVVYVFGRALFDKFVGLVSAFSLATTVHWIHQARLAMLDVFAAVLVTSALFFFWQAWEKGERKFWCLYGLFTGLVFMAKGPLALLPITIVAFFVFFQFFVKQGKLAFGRIFKGALLAAGVFLLVVVPWHALMIFKHGESFVEEYFLYHMFRRAQVGIEQHGKPFFWYLVVIKHWGRLWAAVALLALPAAFANAVYNFRNELGDAFMFCLLWVVLTFLVFSTSASKIQWYIIPIYPVLAIVCGWFLLWLGKQVAQLLARVSIFDFLLRNLALLFCVSVFFYGVLGVVLSKDQWYIEDYNRGFAEASRMMQQVSSEDDVLLVAGSAPGVPIFYSGRKVRTASVDSVQRAAIGSGSFFAVTRQQVLEEIQEKDPAAGLSVYYKDFGYALYGRKDAAE
ncbi:MAG: ArnT family glycosyltransferase [Patescibacteria group bacterium]